jgi:hypothetical protein
MQFEVTQEVTQTTIVFQYNYINQQLKVYVQFPPPPPITKPQPDRVGVFIGRSILE